MLFSSKRLNGAAASSTSSGHSIPDLIKHLHHGRQVLPAIFLRYVDKPNSVFSGSCLRMKGKRQSFISNRLYRRSEATYPFRCCSRNVEWASLHPACFASTGGNGTYMVLLPVGFVMLALSLAPRCALTLRTLACIPHLFTLIPPYLRMTGRYIFCDTFRKIALPGRYPAPCPSREISARYLGMEFGLSS